MLRWGLWEGPDDNLILGNEVIFDDVLGDGFVRNDYDVGLPDRPACGVMLLVKLEP